LAAPRKKGGGTLYWYNTDYVRETSLDSSFRLEGGKKRKAGMRGRERGERGDGRVPFARERGEQAVVVQRKNGNISMRGKWEGK